MREFGRLFIKEIKESVNIAAIYTVLSIGWFIFLAIQKSSWNTELVFGLSFIPLGLLPIYLLLKGFMDYRSEWKDDTIYTLLSLPIPGWVINLAKLTAAMTIYTVLTIITGIGVIVVSQKYIWSLWLYIPRSIEFGELFKIVFIVLVLYWFFGLINYMLSQFSYLVSRLFNRFNGLISGVVFLLSYWFIFRVASLITPLLRWSPDISIYNWGNINGFFYQYENYLETAAGLAILIVGTGIFVLGSWILDQILEV